MFRPVIDEIIPSRIDRIIGFFVNFPAACFNPFFISVFFKFI